MSVLILFAGLVILLNVLLFTAGAAIGLFGCVVDALRAVGSLRPRASVGPASPRRLSTPAARRATEPRIAFAAMPAAR